MRPSSHATTFAPNQASSKLRAVPVSQTLYDDRYLVLTRSNTFGGTYLYPLSVRHAPPLGSMGVHICTLFIFI